MRNADRIDPFCAKLAELWHKVPDWRFGQLMSNVLSEYYGDTKRDPFFVEDNAFIEWMEKKFDNDYKMY